RLHLGLVFQKFRELGSARQVLLWMTSQNIHFPYPSNDSTLTSFEWRPIRYRNVISILRPRNIVRVQSRPVQSINQRRAARLRSAASCHRRSVATETPLAPAVSTTAPCQTRPTSESLRGRLVWTEIQKSRPWAAQLTPRSRAQMPCRLPRSRLPHVA